MNALNAIVERRLQNRYRGRYDFQKIIITIIVCAVIVSLSVSFWLFYNEEQSVQQNLRAQFSGSSSPPEAPNHMLSRPPSSSLSLGMIHPFRISDRMEIQRIVRDGWNHAYMYPDTPACGAGHSPKSPDWLTPWVPEYIPARWGVETGWFVIVIVTCSDYDDHVSRTLDTIDSDPRTGGHWIVWVHPDDFGRVSKQLIERRGEAPKIHRFYPTDFVLVESHAEGDIEKLNLHWEGTMDKEMIHASTYCTLPVASVGLLGLFVQESCIPVADHHRQLPLQKLVKWNTVTVNTTSSFEPKAPISKRNGLNAIRKMLVEVDAKQQFMYNLVFS